jgi:hypothetical protein
MAIVKSPERLGEKRRSGARGGRSKVVICWQVVGPLAESGEREKEKLARGYALRIAQDF